MFYPFDYKYDIIRSDPSGTISEQIKDCLAQVDAFVKTSINGRKLIRINWFFNPDEKLDCEVLRGYIVESGFLSKIRLDPMLIAQAPTDGSDFQLILTSIDVPSGTDVVYQEVSGVAYASVKRDSERWIYVSASGCSSINVTTRESADESFVKIKHILDKEELVFKDILRQWNYIPGITHINKDLAGDRQNYQEFNEVRRNWYHENGLAVDFPAATGIGTDGNVVRLEIVAGRPDGKYRLFSIQNPDQRNAHQYSKDKLVGDVKESTPLFERAKVIFGEGKGHIWVSGTAAIKGEASVEGNVIEQTRITCDNIDRLIDQENLIEAGLPKSGYRILPIYIRAYVKHGKDGPVVRKFLEEKYPGALTHVLKADVCREELLVEVEGEWAVIPQLKPGVINS